MLSTSSYPTASPAPYNPHTHARRRPKLSLQMPSLTINTAVSSMPSAYPLRTPLSPTSRNTQANRRLVVPVPISPASSDDESESLSVRPAYRMESAHHPVTPGAGFLPEQRKSKPKKNARVAFSDDVVVITREWDSYYDHCE